jgi:hypothetical protein
MKKNPFEFEAAIRFTPEEMVDYFIDDNNFARFIRSQRNIFLLGDRGTGKTMMLRYYSLPVQAFKLRKENTNNSLPEYLEIIGIYIPCRSTILAKVEPALLDPQLGRLMSEHLLVVSVVNAIAESLSSIPDLVTKDQESHIRNEMEYLFQWELPPDLAVFEGLRRAVVRESTAIQRALNSRKPDSYYENAVSYSTVVLPLIDILTSNVPLLSSSHFSLMFDDAEALSDLQNLTLNTWIASRSTPRISFKVATSLVDQKPLLTIAGGELLERHDFIRVNMEQDFQSTDAAFHVLAKDIIERRLQKAGITKSAEDFFPINQGMASDLKSAEEKARNDAKIRFEGGGTPKQIRDFVYKYSRAYYFRERDPKANRPPYSGFELIVHVSTGVIRYLLEPCYEMYDATVSRQKGASAPIEEIEPAVQAERLETLSKRRWDWIKHGFNNSVRGCTRDDSKHLFQLLDQLAILLKYRLLHYKSEPRAITFSIAALDTLEDRKRDNLLRLLEIARRAQILFRRTSSGKDDGKRSDYYTFDRILWIDRGLDPVGQNACVSVEAKYLWEAAFNNKALPYDVKAKRERQHKDSAQSEMFELDDI